MYLTDYFFLCLNNAEVWRFLSVAEKSAMVELEFTAVHWATYEQMPNVPAGPWVHSHHGPRPQWKQLKRYQQPEDHGQA